MPEATTIAGRVLDALVVAGILSEEQVESARAETASDADAGRSLISVGLVTEVQLGNVLEDEMGLPRVDLASYAPDDEALEMMPGAVARKHRVLPLFNIEGVLTVAMSEPADVFSADEIAEELGLEIEVVLADPPAVAAAIAQYYGKPAEQGAEAPAETPPAVDAGAFFEGLPTISQADELEISVADFFDVAEEETPVVVGAPTVAEELPEEAESTAQTVEEVVNATPQTTSGIDLDILAVADDRRLTILVADILEQAVGRGASRIHLLPYKNDFFLVFRIGGRLEKIASAPLSIQGPLIEGFKNYAKLGSVPADLPALGRLRAEIGGKSIVLTVSSVPTVAGQRLVVSLAPRAAQLRRARHE